MVVGQEPARFRSFLLRCWEVRREGPGEPAAWRCRLVDVETGQQRGFADLETLVILLKEELEGDQDAVA